MTSTMVPKPVPCPKKSSGHRLHSPPPPPPLKPPPSPPYPCPPPARAQAATGAARRRSWGGKADRITRRREIIVAPFLNTERLAKSCVPLGSSLGLRSTS